MNFFRTDFDDSAWTNFPVPANWETHGYGTPIYISKDGKVVEEQP